MLEYQMLALMTFIFLFAWLPTSVGKYLSFGKKWIASNREPLKDKELLPWAGRCERAYSNLKDYFPGFIVAILLLGIMGKFDETTKYAAILYVVGRVIHYIAYGFGVVTVRALSFTLALGANAVLLIKVFI